VHDYKLNERELVLCGAVFKMGGVNNSIII